ncbi:MAG: aspartyl protease [Candidatus Hydrogenedentota bacterium]|nr:MAG: aspartyl protease [Candidatus Hydrogenedentota bacterium]
MGLTTLAIYIANPGNSRKRRRVECLVDSGAVFSLIDGKKLRELGIRPNREEEFFFANGERVVRKIGNALFFFQGRESASPVIFGEAGDSNLLGSVTLESLQFVLDPFRRELRPLKMMLAGMNRCGEVM